MQNFRIDSGRVNLALGRILIASRTSQGPFKAFRVPQECRNYPLNLKNERDLANFLFVSLLHQSGGNDAENSIRGHRRMYERWPEIYDPRTAVLHSADEIREKMKAVGLTLYENGRYGGRRPEWLLHNANILNEFWGSDPRRIFDGLPENGIEAWEELRRRVCLRGPRKLMGFQEKMLALFVHFLVDTCLVAAVDVSPAIDIHHCRFWGNLELIMHNNKVGPWAELNSFRDQIRTGYTAFASVNETSMLEIGEAVWFYSREMCKHSPSAFTTDGKLVGVASLTPQSGKRKLQGKAYEETCGNCIISDLCNWSMPHSQHYNRGSKKGGLIFVPRAKLDGETPLSLEESSPPTIRCTRHRGKYWATDPTDGCIGCGECGLPLDMPKRLQKPA